MSEDGSPPVFVFRLYVAGGARRSAWAIRNVRALCEEYLPGRHQLEVIDLYQRPELAREEQLLAAPTLIKELPLPIQRFIGTLSDTERVLVSLGLAPPERGRKP